MDEEPYDAYFAYYVAKEGANQQDINDAAIELGLREINTNIHLIPMTMGTYGAQIPLMLASNEPLDIFISGSSSFSSYIESQYIINCADYLDYMPDVLETLGDDVKAGYVGDFLVGFGQMKERGYPGSMVVRKDIFDELGYKIEDFEGLVDDYAIYDKIGELFADVKENYPSMVCFDGTAIMGMNPFIFVDNLGNNFGVLENNETKTVTNYYESEQFRKFCEIARDWFQKGYSSQDIATNQDMGSVKMKAGNTFAYQDSYKPNTDVEKFSQTGYEVRVIRLNSGIKSAANVNSMLYSIANAAQDKVKAAKFMNFIYSSGEFNDLINWGIEGVDWVENEDGMAAFPEGVNSSNVAYHNDYGWAYPNQFAGHPWDGNPADIWDQYREFNAALEPSIADGFTFDSTAVSDEIAQLNSVESEYKKSLAFGAIDVETGMADFNEALYAAGLQKVIDAKQEQLDAWFAAQN